MAKNNKRTYHYIAQTDAYEIRRVTEIDKSFVNKNGEKIEVFHIELMCDNLETDERVYFTDKNLENLKKYKRGQVGVFVFRYDVEIDFGEKTKVTLVEFIESKK